jgi:L-glutamine:2-deoxy-scyllo-inosose/3-amino-2,3-dideoxy-scyllo-inosose aminotransferase
LVSVDGGSGERPAGTGRSAPLAILGGAPTSTARWPPWPQADAATIERVGGVLASGRWTVTGAWTGRSPLDVRFAELFAAFVGTRWCLPVDHGSNALVAALTALGVGPGDEVVVAGLTWVACASAVVRVGAVPVLVDVDQRTLCMDHRAVEAAVTGRTKAILAVHLYSAMAEMDELRRIAATYGLALVEDASQAHGARWDDLAAGALGDVGVFSMHQNKLLTSGEGGAVVTSDPVLHAALEQLRGDGRRYRPRDAPRTLGEPDLEEAGDVQGWNMHLSEMQVALLLDGLERLPGQNARRARAVRVLDEGLSGMEGIDLVRPYARNTVRPFYAYVVLVEPAAFAGLAVDVICEAVSAELGTRVRPCVVPLDVHPLYQPARHPFGRLPGWVDQVDPRRFDLGTAHAVAGRAVVLPHPLLLASDRQVHAIVEAIDKVRRNAHLLGDHRPQQRRTAGEGGP